MRLSQLVLKGEGGFPKSCLGLRGSPRSFQTVDGGFPELLKGTGGCPESFGKVKGGVSDPFTLPREVYQIRLEG
jgi:hypothetical protein